MGATPLRTTTSLRSRFQCIAWGLIPTFVQRVGGGPGTSPTDPDAKAFAIYYAFVLPTGLVCTAPSHIIHDFMLCWQKCEISWRQGAEPACPNLDPSTGLTQKRKQSRSEYLQTTREGRWAKPHRIDGCSTDCAHQRKPP